MGFITETVWQFYKENPGLTTTNLLLSCTFPFDDVFVPYLTGKIVTHSQSGKEFLTELVALVIVLLVMQMVYAFTSWHDAKTFPRLQNFVRHNMIAKLFESFSGSHKELMIGEVMSRLVKIPLTVVNMFEMLKNYLLPYLLSFAITAFMIIQIDKVMGLVILVFVLIVYAIILASPSACLRATQKQEETVAHLDEEIEDVLSNLTTVYTTDQAAWELQRLKTYENEYAKSFANTMGCIIRTRMFAILALGAMLTFFAHRSYTRIKSKTLAIGQFVEMFVIIVQWFTTLGWLSGNIREIVVNWGILASFDRIKSDHDDSVSSTGATANSYVPIIARGSIVFDDVTYIVKTRESPILNSVSFTIHQYERVAIVGDIGSGKSTILKLLVGLIRPSSGDIVIDGISIYDMSLKELRSKIAYVQQHPQLFNRSVLENITYGVEHVNMDELLQVIQSLGVADAFDNLGDGLHSPVGKNGSRLSGGQRQIVACIRTLITNPQIIVLDEVTASIDRKTKQKLFNVFGKMFEKKTVVMVTHDPDMLQMASRVIPIEDGIIQEGKE